MAGRSQVAVSLVGRRAEIAERNGIPFGNLLCRGHFKKEEIVGAASAIIRPYKKPQRSNENRTQGALLGRRSIVIFVPPLSQDKWFQIGNECD